MSQYKVQSALEFVSLLSSEIACVPHHVCKTYRTNVRIDYAKMCDAIPG